MRCKAEEADLDKLSQTASVKVDAAAFVSWRLEFGTLAEDIARSWYMDPAVMSLFTLAGYGNICLLPL